MRVRKATKEEAAGFPSFEKVFQHGVLRTVDIGPGDNLCRVITAVISEELGRIQVTNEDSDFLHSIHIRP